MNSSQVLVSTYNATIEKCIRDLEEAEYWRTPDTELDCWLINGVSIKQVVVPMCASITMWLRIMVAFLDG